MSLGIPSGNAEHVKVLGLKYLHAEHKWATLQPGGSEPKSSSTTLLITFLPCGKVVFPALNCTLQALLGADLLLKQLVFY